MGGEHEQNGIRVVAVLTGPHQRRDVDTERWMVEHDLGAVFAIVHRHRYAARDADEELIALAVSVLTAHLAARHVMDEKPASRHEGHGVPGRFARS